MQNPCALLSRALRPPFLAAPPRVHLGFRQAVDLLELAVATRGPDYQNSPEDVGGYFGGCYYFERNGDPACIVGWVLKSLGIVFPHECRENGARVKWLREAGILHCDDRTHDLLNYAQWLQDSGVSWGAAVARATAWVSTDEHLSAEEYLAARTQNVSKSSLEAVAEPSYVSAAFDFERPVALSPL